MAEVVIKVGLDTADIKRGADKAAADIKTGLNGVEAAAKKTSESVKGVGKATRDLAQLEKTQLDALKSAVQARNQQNTQYQQQLGVTAKELRQIIALHKQQEAEAKRAAAEQVKAAKELQKAQEAAIAAVEKQSTLLNRAFGALAGLGIGAALVGIGKALSLIHI